MLIRDPLWSVSVCFLWGWLISLEKGHPVASLTGAGLLVFWVRGQRVSMFSIHGLFTSGCQTGLSSTFSVSCPCSFDFCGSLSPVH